MWSLIVCAVLAVTYCYAEKIIIIGAGAAGIATAARLLEHNVTDFRILEAESRIGGRIHSLHVGDAKVDIGAQYVHGQKGNTVYELSKPYLKTGKDFDKALLYYGNTRKTGNTLLDEFIALAEETTYTDVNVSIGQAFSSRYNATCLKKYENDPETLTYSHDFLRTIECIILTVDGAFSWYKISSMSNFKFQSGDNFLQFDGMGYQTVLDLLLKNYPQKTGYNIDNQLSFDKTVTRIILKNNSVKIRCKDGSEYSSDHVVFTPSLGVLKHEHKNLFMPRLERPKVDAIEDLGFDGVIKIVVEFATPWWGKNDDFLFVWNDEKRSNLAKDIPFGPTKDGDHWLSWFYMIGTSPKNSKALIGWILGPMVPEVEKLTDDQMKKGITYTLKTFLGKDFDITEPSKVIHSKWYTSPSFRGAYSYETLVSKKHNPSAQEALAEPINAKDGVPRILFAGEATSSHRFATVDGAIETGYREADRLLKILKMK